MILHKKKLKSGSSSRWLVIKFGGTSVSSGGNWRKILEILKNHLDSEYRLLVVCSAPYQVSNQLAHLMDEALEGKQARVLLEVEEKYRELCAELNVDFDALLQSDFEYLTQLAQGIALIGEVTPRIRAQVMAFGELSLTIVASAYLRAQHIAVYWQDVRELLQTIDFGSSHTVSSYLAARCHTDRDPDLLACLSAIEADVIITQGFIARNNKGETVLLGRGGSDVSAAYLAAKISAEHCEIWTDVPGVYTANPHQIPQARLLKYLDYAEAQEIASMGGRVLHPNCIAPLKQHQIPLHVKNTLEPEREGTIISLHENHDQLRIKSVITKNGILLISIETIRMWRQVGFLARVFECFKQHGLSVDLVSTSESNITVSLDANGDMPDPQVIETVLADLNSFAKATTIGPCASISLIGRHIRSILYQLGDVFSVFEEQQIHLLSQAANDLNLTFVVDEMQAQRLSQELHALLIEPNSQEDYLGEAWQKDLGQFLSAEEKHWWQKRREQLINLIAEKNRPLYVYDQSTLDQSVEKLRSCPSIDFLYYSMKANYYSKILERFYELNLGFECVSIEEVEHLLKLFPKMNPSRILFTPNFAPKIEYEKACQLGIWVTVDSLYPLEQWPEIFARREILVRIDPGKGHGHHKYVCTGGAHSKFGISLGEVDHLLKLMKMHKFKIIGLHAHAGSGILRAQTWQENCLVLTNLLNRFKDVKYINLGGGLGIAEKPGQSALNLESFNHSLEQVKLAYPHCQFWLEPGRFLVAAGGVLLARVTQVKEKNGVMFIGVETGMNSLIRPALYGSFHEIVNLTRYDQPKTQIAHVVGPICESGDTLGYSRLLPETYEGDVLLIANTGAYGHCMSSNYNLRTPADEIYLVESLISSKTCLKI